MPVATETAAGLQELLGKVVVDVGAAAGSALVLVGDKLGLYKTLVKNGWTSPGDLAAKTGTSERYIREWLSAQAAAGYVEYDPETGLFSMTDDQAAIFADEDSPYYMAGGFYGAASVLRDEPRLLEAFRTGEGVGWGDHDEALFAGTEKMFRPSYRAHLVSSWIPSLQGVEEKLRKGARVADVGCGHGTSTLILAEAFPRSEFVGFDFHEASVVRARKLARKAGLKNVTFQVASAKGYPGTGYDLVTMFDCLHDMGDPVGAAAHVRETLAADGTWLIVEPFAHDTLQENLNPVGRVYYAFSTMVCTPSSLNQEVGLALGAQAGEARLREVAEKGGFQRFRRAAETPFNLILEAKP